MHFAYTDFLLHLNQITKALSVTMPTSFLLQPRNIE
jgi:hypothetical protein